MPIITTISHFVGDIMLPNTAITNPEGIVLDADITRYEPEMLKALLGYELYTLFEAGVINDTAKYLLIKNGSEFTDSNDRLQKWDGFVLNKNPIANYIFYWNRRNAATSTTGNGETATAVENGSRVSSNQKMVTAWNRMVDLNRKLHAFLVANEDDYTEYAGFSYPYWYSDCPLWESEEAKMFKNLFTKINTWSI
jgi:hypothetical protein